ncbi:MAG: hypothetical protein FWG56_04540, partial [Desulfovibrionaceae bacterium]|nr:hypothetical protein [Desulfovibrionaceae bacterium]
GGGRGWGPAALTAVTAAGPYPGLPEGAEQPGKHHEAQWGAALHFVPGFPVMAWPMIEWVLDRRYPHLRGSAAWQERSLIVLGAMEATLTPVMQRVEAAHPGVKVFSLPSVDHPEYGPHIDLGVKGAPTLVAPAYADLRVWLAPFGLKYGPEAVRNSA